MCACCPEVSCPGVSCPGIFCFRVFCSGISCSGSASIPAHPISLRLARPLGLAAAALAVIAMTGCGGSVPPIQKTPPQGKTQVTILLSTTANDQLSEYELNFLALNLTNQAGTTVSLLPATKYDGVKYDWAVHGGVCPPEWKYSHADNSERTGRYVHIGDTDCGRSRLYMYSRQFTGSFADRVSLPMDQRRSRRRRWHCRSRSWSQAAR